MPSRCAISCEAQCSLPFTAAAADSDNFVSLHGEFFILMDGDGRIRGYYRKDDASLDRLLADAEKLLPAARAHS